MTGGVLYIVATPIGNLKDITIRALEVLKEVDYILSEDTRETDKVLRAYSISKPQISYREQNHAKIVGKIIDDLKAGLKIALVSDSGTPLISDPGFKLVESALLSGIPVSTTPGPSAVIAALTLSGLPTDKFSFLGFLPRSGSQRQKMLKAYGGLDSTLIIYESPFRVNKLLQEAFEVLGNRMAAVVSELTKLNESVVKDKLDNLILTHKTKRIKGEHVVLIAKEGY